MCCVIGIFDKVPKLKQLRKMEKANPHGSSITWIKNGLVNYVKGEKLTSKEILRIINKENITKDFIIHYRITSSGSTCDELCHPFIINSNGHNPQILRDSDQSVLIHNGTLDESWKDLLIQTCIANKITIPKGKLSDSRATAFLINFLGDGILNLTNLEDEKFVIVSPKGIKKFGKFEKANNILCSNNYHIHNSWYMDQDSTSYGFDDNKYTCEDLCRMCDVNGIDVPKSLCTKHNKTEQDMTLDDYEELFMKDNINSRRYDETY